MRLVFVWSIVFTICLIKTFTIDKIRITGCEGTYNRKVYDKLNNQLNVFRVMEETKPFLEPPKSQKPLIQGLENYVEKHFGNFSFAELRYIRPDTPIYNSIVEMQRKAGKLQEGEELGGCCGMLPTGEAVIYLVNKHKQGHQLPFDGLLYEMIHLAKPDWNAEKVEQETDRHLQTAREHAKISAYNATHKRKKPYPK